MKKLSTYLFLLLFSFQTPSWADVAEPQPLLVVDIRDLQIEGMSIGDSLLDYFSKEEINNYIIIDWGQKDITFTQVEFSKISFFKVYDSVDLFYKTSDKNYKIERLSGIIDYRNNIKNCRNKKKEVLNEISNLFKNKKFINDKGKNVVDKSGKSKYDMDYFYFKNGDYLSVACYGYSEESNYMDHLSITLATKAVQKFLETQVYK